MAAGDTQITIAGNLVDDPELRFTPSGQPVAKFRVASTPRFLDKNTNEWKDGDSLFLTCNVWRQAAENVAESLTRGTRVIVSGRLRQRSYETKEGEKRTVYEVEVDDVGPSLRNASAKVSKMARSGGDGNYGNGGQRSSGGRPSGGQGAQGGSGSGAGFEPTYAVDPGRDACRFDFLAVAARGERGRNRLRESVKRVGTGVFHVKRCRLQAGCVPLHGDAFRGRTAAGLDRL